MGVEIKQVVLGIPVVVLGAVSELEVNYWVEEEIAQNDPEKRKITCIRITEVSDEEVDINIETEGVVRRVRRITGYLSDINNFNEAKTAELFDRYTHGG